MKKMKKNNNFEKQIVTERKYQLEDLKYIINNYNLITLNGNFGIGKTFLKESLLKDKNFKKEYLDIEINAYTDNTELLDLFFKKIILKNKKIKAFHYKKPIFNPNINNWFGKFIFNFNKIASIILSIFSPTFIACLITLKQINNISLKLMWILIITTSVTWILFLLIVFCSFCALKYNKIENLSKLKRKKYWIFKNKNKKIIFIIEDLNRLENSEKQTKFLQNFLSFKNKIDKNNNIKCLFLANYDSALKNDWTKYFDFDFSITNLYETTSNIFFLELEKIDINWKLIEENINDKYELKDILDLIFNNKNIRLLELFIKKIKMHKELILNINSFKINIIDLFSYIYLSVYEKEIYLYINNNPNIICSNNLKLNEEGNNQNKLLKKNYDIKWTNLIKSNENEENSLFSDLKYKGIRKNLLPLTKGILRFQTKEYSNVKNQSEENNQINITDNEYFYFYKSPQHYQTFIEKYNNFININKFNKNLKIQTIFDYANKELNDPYTFFGLKTFQIFTKTVFFFMKENNNKRILYNNLKNEMLTFLIIEPKAFAIDRNKISQISISFKEVFKNEISEEINTLIKKYKLEQYIYKEPNLFWNNKDKYIDFAFIINNKENKKDFKWLILLSNIFFQNEIREFKNNFIIDKINHKELQTYYLFNEYTLFNKKKNNKLKQQVETIINYERKNNKSNKEFISELMLYDIYYPCRTFPFFSDENLKIINKILNSEDEKSQFITKIIINSNSSTYDFYYGSNWKEFWTNEEVIFKDLKINYGEFNYWLIKNHKDKFEKFLNKK